MNEKEMLEELEKDLAKAKKGYEEAVGEHNLLVAKDKLNKIDKLLTGYKRIAKNNDLDI